MPYSTQDKDYPIVWSIGLSKTKVILDLKADSIFYQLELPTPMKVNQICYVLFSKPYEE